MGLFLELKRFLILVTQSLRGVYHWISPLLSPSSWGLKLILAAGKPDMLNEYSGSVTTSWCSVVVLIGRGSSFLSAWKKTSFYRHFIIIVSVCSCGCGTLFSSFNCLLIYKVGIRRFVSHSHHQLPSNYLYFPSFSDCPQ